MHDDKMTYSKTKYNLKCKILARKVNDKAVSKRASALNGGIKCEIEHPPALGRESLMGCGKYQARICFTDNGSVRLIRVPRMNSSIPQSLANYLVRSEYATLKFLETTQVPTPRAFDYGISDDTKPAEISLEATEQFYLKHLDDKGDHLMVDDELNTIGIIYLQTARVVPAGEAFGPSLATAEMDGIYNGRSSLTVHDLALARFLEAKGATSLAGIMSRDEKVRRFFFGLEVDLFWEETLSLI
ncbi:hypothetical protein PDE_01466 [Penicillium oxalicum 114-2]|uniref:Aminoglycoside phosphotransferase domain-containing protein n=1 Tax=Penicillium oxalicum (strain 114-2 / CGMCC 5302) TaxID=933388 RepID=S7Z8J8_PENO1|nr:hypothetical protein PDE_01466 [Penicillium oxalicum 114-2]